MYILFYYYDHGHSNGDKFEFFDSPKEAVDFFLNNVDYPQPMRLFELVPCKEITSILDSLLANHQ